MYIAKTIKYAIAGVRVIAYLSTLVKWELKNIKLTINQYNTKKSSLICGIFELQTNLYNDKIAIEKRIIEYTTEIL